MRTARVFRQRITLRSAAPVVVLDVTEQIREILRKADVEDGLLVVHSLHTTCALFVNEFQAALIEDLKAMLRRLVADNGRFKHNDSRYSDCERGNASAHLRAALLGHSVILGISGGELSLGRFQSILFAELDGPRSRGIDIHIVGA
jgi:secondary thiamine-phosphate synthase enzyme